MIQMRPVIRPLLLCCWLLAVTLSPKLLAATEVDQELRQLLKDAANSAESFDDRFDAEVWLLDMNTRIRRYVEDDQERLHILRSAHREASRAGLPVDLVLAVIHTESRFQRFAISSVGAQGLMQVMSFWKNEIGRSDDNLTDIDTNLRYGCTILAYYLKKANNDLTEALARYNGSYGSYRYPRKVYAALDRYEE
ncbi:lytic transglycosylase domain-containing protein [Motiliproteus sediminis]|uniref:lytic transglycosylase domain-containing protein n=1 Tax=Motiliproteus sediminis TaxID=1468178 RepID=UPI001AEFF7CE|nr:lytic transglycosylase domain-containing protein [Motiliproteus sediminis]